MNDQFVALYRNLNLISQAGKGLPIHRACSNAEKCWKDVSERFPPDDDGISHICKPWIGPEYNKLRLVAIGENLNEYGGMDALIELTEEAKELIAAGYRRVRFHAAFDEYPGSFLWHRLGCYSAAIGEFSGALHPTWETDGYPSAESVSNAFDFIAFVEHIKCSPTGNKSKPTTTMWENCGRHILRNELLELQPTQVLVLGASNNSWYLSEHVFDSKWTEKKEFGSVIRVRGILGGVATLVWVVPHPTSYGGNSKSILEDLRNALHLTNNPVHEE